LVLELPGLLCLLPIDIGKSSTRNVLLEIFLQFVMALHLPNELLANITCRDADLEVLRGLVARPLGEMPRRTRSELDSFPALKALGLEPVQTIGNGIYLEIMEKRILLIFPGNCLFAALSDQLYGNPDHQAEFRAMAVEYERNHKELFMGFLAAKEGGGTRRQPKRKNAGGYSTSVDHGSASEKARELQFSNHLSAMAKNGTYADEMEILALAKALGVDIKVYLASTNTSYAGGDEDEARPVAYIAYHVC
jgi:hypothetical protein